MHGRGLPFFNRGLDGTEGPWEDDFPVTVHTTYAPGAICIVGTDVPPAKQGHIHKLIALLQDHTVYVMNMNPLDIISSTTLVD